MCHNDDEDDARSSPGRTIEISALALCNFLFTLGEGTGKGREGCGMVEALPRGLQQHLPSVIAFRDELS